MLQDDRWERAMDLQPPTRNNYFFGELLDADDFTTEQDYHVRKRRLINRTAVGAGILCGLEVAATPDGELKVEPGVALDHYGREIVVGAPQTVDPRQLTDEAGSLIPAGGSKQVTLYLCYAESESSAEPVFGSEAQAARIVEGFTTQVREGRPRAAVGLLDRQREAIFPATPLRDFDRRAAACESLTAPCSIPDEACVVLATVTLLADGGVEVEPCGGRVQIYSNAQLLDLILALADQVDRLERKGRPDRRLRRTATPPRADRCQRPSPRPARHARSDRRVTERGEHGAFGGHTGIGPG
jgi:hypothetical protein